jgi:hypothetical protein
MTFDIYLVGGSAARVELDADDLQEASEQLRRDRSLIGKLVAMNGEAAVGRVLIPSQRIALVGES